MIDPTDDTTKLRTVYTTGDSATASIIKNALVDEGIQCEITGEHQGGLVGLDIMKIELLVREDDYEKAKLIIDRL